MIAVNTILLPKDGIATSFNDYRTEPRQIDYIHTRNLNIWQRGGCICFPAYTEAKVSYHRPVWLGIPILELAEADEQAAVENTSTPPLVVKLIGWKCSDRDGFSEQCLNGLHIAGWEKTRAPIAESKSIFRDGSFGLGRPRAWSNSRRTNDQCGWAFAAFPSVSPARGVEPLVQRCGAVELAKDHPSFIGGVRRTNNVGELCTAVEACIWLLTQIGEEVPVFLPGDSVQIFFDSYYVIGISTHEHTPKANTMLACTLQLR